MARKTVHGNCEYCGKEDVLTEDHVIPQCLFPNKIPADASKVWACKQCNGVVKSGLDTYLQDLLVTDMHTSQSPIAQQPFSKFSRAVGRNRSKFARDILQNSQLVELRTPAGLYGGQAYTSQEANEKTLDILWMYVRGLYAYYYHKLLLKDMEFDFVRAGINKELNNVIRMLNEKGGSAYIGDGNVFQCSYGQAVDVPEAGIWILNFLRRALFVVIVKPKNLGQQPTAKQNLHDGRCSLVIKPSFLYNRSEKGTGRYRCERIFHFISGGNIWSKISYHPMANVLPYIAAREL